MNDQIDETRTEIEREKTARDILGVDYTADETEIKTWKTATMNGVTLNGGK